MMEIGFLYFTEAPTEESALNFPDDIDPPTEERRSKTVFVFHDETTFNANEDQSMQWGFKGEK